LEIKFAAMNNMLHHLSLPVSDIAASARLYDALLHSLGYRRVAESAGFIGYGTQDNRDKFAIVSVNAVAAPRPGFHLAFRAANIRAVDSFHQTALQHGATDNGAPGLRPDYGTNYYAAFIVDLDGHHIEAVCND
jgi:catechol 2,3-dioxygenase-like lactoylglutathione lyase family enzyme